MKTTFRSQHQLKKKAGKGKEKKKTFLARQYTKFNQGKKLSKVPSVQPRRHVSFTQWVSFASNTSRQKKLGDVVWRKNRKGSKAPHVDKWNDSRTI